MTQMDCCCYCDNNTILTKQKKAWLTRKQLFYSVLRNKQRSKWSHPRKGLWMKTQTKPEWKINTGKCVFLIHISQPQRTILSLLTLNNCYPDGGNPTDLINLRADILKDPNASRWNQIFHSKHDELSQVALIVHQNQWTSKQSWVLYLAASIKRWCSYKCLGFSPACLFINDGWTGQESPCTFLRFQRLKWVVVVIQLPSSVGVCTRGHAWISERTKPQCPRSVNSVWCATSTWRQCERGFSLR